MKTESDVGELLEEGDLRVLGLLPRASNYTFLGEIRNGPRRLPVVYKPRAGETPLWDFPDGTLGNREAAAFVLAEALGWPNVPPTVLRHGPHGVGSVQLYVETDPGEHYFTLRERRLEEFRTVAAFDAVTGNGDRKSGHCLLGRDGRIWVVDHGLCFNARPVLRTVIWEFAGEPVPPALLEDVRRVERDLREGGLRRAPGAPGRGGGRRGRPAGGGADPCRYLPSAGAGALPSLAGGLTFPAVLQAVHEPEGLPVLVDRA